MITRARPEAATGWDGPAPHATLATLLRADPRVRLVVAPHGEDLTVHAIAVIGPTEPEPSVLGAVVLAVGWGPGDLVAARLRRLAAAGAAALAVRGEPGRRVTRLAGTAGLSLLVLPPELDWMTVARGWDAAVSSAPPESAPPGGTPGRSPAQAGLGTRPLADLFETANSVAAAVGAPVTIEDLSSRVLAFSEHHSTVDSARIDAILGRKVPAERVRGMRRRGLFDQIHAAHGPVDVPPPVPEALPRLAVALRAGSEVFGTMWALFAQAPTSAQRAAFRDAAPHVSLQLRQHLWARDAAEQQGDALVLTALRAGPEPAGPAEAEEAAGALGLAPVAHRVVVLASRDARAPALELRQVLTAASRHLASGYGPVRTAYQPGRLYAVVPTPAGVAEGRAATLRLAAAAHQELPPTWRSEVVIVVGSHAPDRAALPASREECDELLHVVRERAVTGPVLSREQIAGVAFLHRLGHGPVDPAAFAPFAALAAHDQEKGTRYVATLAAYYEALGDRDEAAHALVVHRNTVRYRLERIEALWPGILASPADRLAFMVCVAVSGVPSGGEGEG